MDIELYDHLSGARLKVWQEFLARAALTPDTPPGRIALLFDGDTLIATGAREGSLLKYIAVDSDRQGEDLTASILTALRRDAFDHGIRHLFLCTKPENRRVFSSLFFHPIAETGQVLLMEDRRNGIADFLGALPALPDVSPVGAVVVNCNPFTRGHRFLIEQAAADCGHLCVFVLSEDKSRFTAHDRIEMVRRGTADLPNVTVMPTGPYLLSTATFPTYFLRDRDRAPQIQCQLDIEVFTRYFAPRFSITRRYVGTEPTSLLTARYNDALIESLPACGIACIVIPRLAANDVPISASEVRRRIDCGEIESLHDLLPDTTFDYLQANGLLTPKARIST